MNKYLFSSLAVVSAPGGPVLAQGRLNADMTPPAGRFSTAGHENHNISFQISISFELRGIGIKKGLKIVNVSRTS